MYIGTNAIFMNARLYGDSFLWDGDYETVSTTVFGDKTEIDCSVLVSCVVDK
jgi:hypothetical protein